MGTFSHSSKIPVTKLNDGSVMPVLGITANADGYNRTKDALQLGIRHINIKNSVDCYDVTLAIINCGLPRSHFFITATAPFLEDLSQKLDNVLKELTLPWVDLFLMELEPYNHDWQLTVAWTAMEQIKLSKRARSIGVAGMRIEELSVIVREAKQFLPAVNQVEFHPLCQQTELLRWSKLQGITTATYEPLVGMAGSAMAELTSNGARDVFSNISLAYQVPIAAIILKWIALSGVVIVTTGITTCHLETQLKIFEIGMTNNEFDNIMAAGLEKPDNDTVNAQVKAETVKVEEEAQVYDKHASTQDKKPSESYVKSEE